MQRCLWPLTKASIGMLLKKPDEIYIAIKFVLGGCVLAAANLGWLRVGCAGCGKRHREPTQIAEKQCTA